MVVTSIAPTLQLAYHLLWHVLVGLGGSIRLRLINGYLLLTVPQVVSAVRGASSSVASMELPSAVDARYCRRRGGRRHLQRLLQLRAALELVYRLRYHVVEA